MEEPLLMPIASAVRHLDAVSVDSMTATAVGHGRQLDIHELGVTGDGPWAVHDADGDLLAVYERHEDRAKATVVIPR